MPAPFRALVDFVPLQVNVDHDRVKVEVVVDITLGK